MAADGLGGGEASDEWRGLLPPPRPVTVPGPVRPPRQVDEELWRAVQRQEAYCVEELLAQGARPGLFWSEAGLTVLQRAALNGTLGILQVLLSARADVDARASGDSEGETALSLAVLRSERSCVEALLSARADPNLHGRLHHGSPLHTAVCVGDQRFVELLLLARAAVNERDTTGYTPCLRALQQGSHEIVRLLVEHSAEAGMAMPHGCTALDLMEDMLASNLPLTGLAAAATASPAADGGPSESWPPRPPPDEAEADLCPPARALPDLPACPPPGPAHGILVLGEEASGKSSLVLSLLTLARGVYPSRADAELEEKRRTMPRHGQHYAFPEGSVPTYLGHPAQVLVTDTPALGLAPLSLEPPQQALQELPRVHSWLRAALCWEQPHHAVVLALDATEPPMWENCAYRRDITELLVTLRRRGHLVVVAVTKLLKARENALRDVAYGAEHGGRPGRDPHRSYETWVERYLSRLAATLETTARENGWRWEDELGAPAPPRANAMIFDAPAWTSLGDFQMWRERRGTVERPNHRYMVTQLEKLLQAALPSTRPAAWAADSLRAPSSRPWEGPREGS